MNLLPVQPAHALAACPAEDRWLIEGLWSDQAVGIVGGEPKSCKSFLALDMAVSVASGAPCLRRFSVARTGRVLLFAAEDALHVVRQRLEGICDAANVSLAALDIQVITAPTLRLDLADHRRRLTDTVNTLRPKLLLLDPFVRLHRIDENASSEVAPLLGYLRELQRLYSLAVVVVHHARKGAAKIRAGQALRGSSEFHAWGDSNLYLRRGERTLSLTIEHRAAASSTGIPIALKAQGQALALEVVDTAPLQSSPPTLSPAQRIEEALARSSAPLTLSALRQSCRIRTEHLCDAIAILKGEGRIIKTEAGYSLASR